MTPDEVPRSQIQHQVSQSVPSLKAEDHGSRASVTLDNAECRKSKERVQRANGLPSHSCYLTDTGSRERDGSAGTISAQGDIDHPEAMQEGRGATDRANRKGGRRPSAAGGKRILILRAGHDGQHPLLRYNSGGTGTEKGPLEFFTNLQRSWVRIPPARFLDIPERLFSLKRFQRESGIAGFLKERRNRYWDNFQLQNRGNRIF